MPDQAPNQESDDRSILDSEDSSDGSPSKEEASSSFDPSEPNTHSPPAEGASSDPTEAEDQTVDDPSPPTSPEDADSDVSETSGDVEDLHFEDEELGETLRHASEEQLNDAPFGIIRVDDEGVVEFFNRYESELSGMDPEEVMGRNFFTQVAPCTNNRLFRGRFKKGVRRGELDETFTYTYTYKMRPTLVDVHLYRDEEGNNWITVQKY